jgi:integrating conjugative element protein (TIGR03746 family)
VSRYKSELVQLQAHVKTLRLATMLLFGLALVMGLGWCSAPRDLTVHVPPDLRTGSTRKWWDVPPESVYAFSTYVWQQLHRWPTNGEEDYARNIRALENYFTPACRAFLQEDYASRRNSGDLRQRVRGLYEIPGRGYGDQPTQRVQSRSTDTWVVTLDVTADEYHASELVKRALVRYPLRVIRRDVDPQRNPFGLVIDCYDSPPQRIAAPADAAANDASNTSNRGTP